MLSPKSGIAGSKSAPRYAPCLIRCPTICSSGTGQSRFSIIANRAVAFDLGYTPDDIPGKTDFDLHPRDLAQRFWRRATAGDPQRHPALRPPRICCSSTGRDPLAIDLQASFAQQRRRDRRLVGVSRATSPVAARPRTAFATRLPRQVTGLANRAAFEARLDALSSAPLANKPFCFSSTSIASSRSMMFGRCRLATSCSACRRNGRFVGPSDLVAPSAATNSPIVRRRTPPSVGSGDFRCHRPELRLAASWSIHGASVGVTAIDGGVGPMEALRRADLALYAVKARGRGCWQQFGHEMATAVERRNSLETISARRSPIRSQFFTLYQPVYAADGRTIVGAEALVRWRHPRFGAFRSRASSTSPRIRAHPARRNRPRRGRLSRAPTCPGLRSTSRRCSCTHPISPSASCGIIPPPVPIRIACRSKSPNPCDRGQPRCGACRHATARRRRPHRPRRFRHRRSSLAICAGWSSIEPQDRPLRRQIGTRSADAIIAAVACSVAASISSSPRRRRRNRRTARLPCRIGRHELQGLLTPSSRPAACSR